MSGINPIKFDFPQDYRNANADITPDRGTGSINGTPVVIGGVTD